MAEDEDDDLESSSNVFSSLQKYRPCNYDFPAPADSDDINNIADYYLSMGTRQRAMNRVYKPNSSAEGIDSFGGSSAGKTSRFLNRRYSHQQQDQDDDKFSNSGVVPMTSNELYHNQDQQFNQEFDQTQPDLQQNRQDMDYFDRLEHGFDNGHQLQQHPRRFYGYQQQEVGYPGGHEGGHQGGYQGGYQASFQQGCHQQIGYQQQPFYGYQQQMGYPPPAQPHRRNQDPNLDLTTTQLLKRAHNAYSHTTSILNEANKFNRDQQIQDTRRNGGKVDEFGWARPEPVQRNPDESMMSSKTRSLLDKLKESTNVLEEMSEDAPVSAAPRRGGSQRQSRFLKRQESEPSYQRSYSPVSSYQPRMQQRPQEDNYVSRLADEVLGESNYPPMSSSERYSNSRRKTSAPASYQSRRGWDEDSLPEPSRRFDDEEDLDSMINNLKKKTSGRDMYQVLSEIEGRNITPPRNQDNGDFYGREDLRESRPRASGNFPVSNRRDVSTGRGPSIPRGGRNSRRSSFDHGDEERDFGFGRASNGSQGPFGGSGQQRYQSRTPYYNNSYN